MYYLGMNATDNTKKIGSFSAPLVGQFVPVSYPWWKVWAVRRGRWNVHEPFAFIRPNGDRIIIPRGWSCDLASVDVLPFPASRFFPPDGAYAQAAVVHDFVCAAELFPINVNNTIMSEAMDAIPECNNAAKWFVRRGIDIGTAATYGEHSVHRIAQLRALVGITDMKRPLWVDGKARFPIIVKVMV
jgi:hypothetical protein